MTLLHTLCMPKRRKPAGARRWHTHMNRTSVYHGGVYSSRTQEKPSETCTGYPLLLWLTCHICRAPTKPRCTSWHPTGPSAPPSAPGCPRPVVVGAVIRMTSSPFLFSRSLALRPDNYGPTPPFQIKCSLVHCSTATYLGSARLTSVHLRRLAAAIIRLRDVYTSLPPLPSLLPLLLTRTDPTVSRSLIVAAPFAPPW